MHTAPTILVTGEEPSISGSGSAGPSGTRRPPGTISALLGLASGVYNTQGAGRARGGRQAPHSPARQPLTWQVAADWRSPSCGDGLRRYKVIEVFVESIRVNMANYKRVVMLKEKTGSRFLPIWIGHFEADAIAIPMQNVPVSRPLTHDLLGRVAEQLGGKLTQIVINDLADETFYARLVLDQNGQHLEVDSRPSDAIALAIRAKVPIYVEDAVLDQAGMVFESEEAEGEASATKEDATPVDEEKLTIFKQFIETLDIDDLGKGGGSIEPKEPKR
jgi:bifunctional DNase/RNase